MSTAGMATPSATMTSKTPKKTQSRKHGTTTAKVDENHRDGTPKTAEELIIEILGTLDTGFKRLTIADKKELEDILDLLDQFTKVLEHHPEHGKLMGHIGGLQYQAKKFKKEHVRETKHQPKLRS